MSNDHATPCQRAAVSPCGGLNILFLRYYLSYVEGGPTMPLGAATGQVVPIRTALRQWLAFWGQQEQIAVPLAATCGTLWSPAPWLFLFYGSPRDWLQRGGSAGRA